MIDRQSIEQFEPTLQPLARAQVELANALAEGDERAIGHQARSLSQAVQQSARHLHHVSPESLEQLGSAQRELSIMLQARLIQTRQVIDASDSKHRITHLMAESATNPVDNELTGLIEDPQEAARLLVRLRRMRNVITLRAAQSPREFSSILLSLDLTHHYLVLDAPRPQPQATDFRPGTKIYARSHVDGAAIVFTAQLNSLIAADDTGDDNLVLDWPTRVSYYQRRRDYRVSVPSTVVQTPARLIIDERAVKARLLDLSTSGVAILLAEADTMVAKDSVVECILPLPERDLKVPFRVTAVAGTRDGQRISGELQLEDSRSRELIQRTVTTLERWWLQHHP